MLIKEIYTFMTVASAGSFLNASRRLYTTPASVMNQMNRLEKIVGVPLLERTNQGVRLTAAGRHFYENAKNIEESARRLLASTREIGGAEKCLIRVGTSILRPCRQLIALSGTLPYNIRIIPFDDAPEALAGVMEHFGSEIDCIFSPCDSRLWSAAYSILVTSEVPCRVAVPRRHALAGKKRLTWPDLAGNTFMLVKRGASPRLGALRDELEARGDIRIVDAPDFYDTNIFNICEENNYLMESLDIWRHIHPHILTLPMEWSHCMPLGIVYAKEPSPLVRDFIAAVRLLIYGRNKGVGGDFPAR